MRIVLAGVSGFLGHPLVEHLRQRGHELIRLVRHDPSAPDERRWWPEQRELDRATLSGTDAVINLCGAGLAHRRWTRAYKAEIQASRVDPTAAIAAAMTTLPAQR